MKPLVSICSITYNHAPYIRQCLDGFLMQKTSFPFEIIIHDDCSTDGTTEIIREYTAKYPHLFVPIFQTENQYSKGVRGMFATFVFPCAKGKYVAMCEGDDYWIDPLKLQKQVDFLEANPEYSMCCSDAIIRTDHGIENWCRYRSSQEIPIKDIIEGGGLFLQTASLLFRKNIYDNYPEFAKKCHVGDYPLQIFLSLKGKVFWFADKQVVYRFAIGNSWTATNNSLEITRKIASWRSEINMLQDFDSYSNFVYSKYFQWRQFTYVRRLIKSNINEYKKISSQFKDIKKMYPLKYKIEDFIIRCHLYPIVIRIKIFFCKL